MRINVNLGEGINSNTYKGQNGNETSDRVDRQKILQSLFPIINYPLFLRDYVQGPG